METVTTAFWVILIFLATGLIDWKILTTRLQPKHFGLRYPVLFTFNFFMFFMLLDVLGVVRITLSGGK